MKKYPFFFILLFVSLFLGTLSLVGISFVSSQVREKLKNNANQLLTSDLSVSARRELFQYEKDSLDKLLKTVPHEQYEVIDIYSMVARVNEGTSRLVEIRATEQGFPFYGKISTVKGSFSNDDLFISKDLAEMWQLKTGEELKIGEITLKISGIVNEDSSMGQRGFSLAPRIYFPLSRLADTGLIKPGATGNFSHHFKFKNHSPELVKSIKSEIYQSIKDSAIKVTLPEDSSEQTGRVIKTITNFMALSALVGLILSLVGVFYLYQSHLLARLKDLALLNLHGMTKKEITLGIVCQFSFVFFTVIAFELLILIPLYRLASPILSTYLGMDLDKSISILDPIREIPLLYILSLSVLAPLIFGLMRTSLGLQLKATKISLGRFKFVDFIPFSIMLLIFSSYLSHSVKIGGLFFVALLLVFILSTLTVKVGQKILRKMIGSKGLLLPTIENGLALRSFTRSGHKMTLSFLSLAMGATLISLILQLDKMILSEFSFDEKRPSLFLFDIQEDQLDPLKKLFEANQSPLAFVTPMIRARLEMVNGKKFERKKRDIDLRSREEDNDDTRFRNNGLNLTYRNYLTDAEKIVEGDPFPVNGNIEERLPYVSLEKRWSQRMGVSIGDKLTFDIQGVEFEAVVLNIKEIKWTTFYPNFFVTIEPGIIDGAPKTFLAVLPSSSKEQKISLQRLTVEKFPNISFIDVEEIVKKISNLFIKSRKAIEIISWLSLLVGLVILYGLSHDQVYRRYYDLALMKSLGFTSYQLRLNLLYEFGTLFMSALGLGFFLGWVLAQLIGKEIFKLSYSIDWSRMIYPGIFLTILCLSTILISSWRAVKARPRELLSDS